MGGLVAEHDSPAGEPSDTPWEWSSVRERATTSAPARLLPSTVGAELVAALRPVEVPAPEPGAERRAVRRERRTTWGLRVAGAAFVTLAGAGLLATDIGAGVRDEVLAQLPDLLVPGSGAEPLEPAAGPATDPSRLDPPAAPVVPGTRLAPVPVPLEPTAPVVDPAGPVDPPGPTTPPPAPPPSEPTPAPRARGSVSSLLDPVLGGVADVAGGATGGLTSPVAAVVLPVTDAVTDLLDGVADPVVGLLGDLATGR